MLLSHSIANSAVYNERVQHNLQRDTRKKWIQLSRGIFFYYYVRQNTIVVTRSFTSFCICILIRGMVNVVWGLDV